MKPESRPEGLGSSHLRLIRDHSRKIEELVEEYSKNFEMMKMFDKIDEFVNEFEGEGKQTVSVNALLSKKETTLS